MSYRLSRDNTIYIFTSLVIMQQAPYKDDTVEDVKYEPDSASSIKLSKLLTNHLASYSFWVQFVDLYVLIPRNPAIPLHVLCVCLLAAEVQMSNWTITVSLII